MTTFSDGAACDPPSGQALPARRLAPSTVQARARGEDFRIIQPTGDLFVCTIAFCAPSCTKQFLAEPNAYLVA